MPRRNLLGLTEDDSVPFALRVPKALRESWEQYAASMGETSAEALRAVMRERVGHAPHAPKPEPTPPPALLEQDVGRLDAGKTKRLEIRLTVTERAAVERIAAAQECGPHYWITSLIRATLTGTPHFGMTQARTLADSNYQLMAIGRNLNQIAHHLNADPTTTNRVKVEHIEVLTAEIDRHRSHVGALMQACSGRWLIATGETNHV